MKTVKTILIIISIFIFIFLATGLVVKDTSYQVTQTINKPISKVFKSFSQLDSTKNWIPDIQSIAVIDKKPNITGSLYNVAVKSNGQEIKMTQKVLAYVPNKKITYYYDAENMLKKDDFTFQEANGKTTITLNANCQSESYIMACIFPYFKSTFIAQDQLHLDNFKAYIEQQ